MDEQDYDIVEIDAFELLSEFTCCTSDILDLVNELLAANSPGIAFQISSYTAIAIQTVGLLSQRCLDLESPRLEPEEEFEIVKFKKSLEHLSRAELEDLAIKLKVNSYAKSA